MHRGCGRSSRGTVLWALYVYALIWALYKVSFSFFFHGNYMCIYIFLVMVGALAHYYQQCNGQKARMLHKSAGAKIYSVVRRGANTTP